MEFIDTLIHTQASIEVLWNNLSNRRKNYVKTVKRHAYIIQINISATNAEK